jgi:hypothetical protein
MTSFPYQFLATFWVSKITQFAERSLPGSGEEKAHSGAHLHAFCLQARTEENYA